ncbi:ribokinase [Enterococcus gilvus]|uniref:ribokinase n=1 Tax=Enterococcus gilvus TaxID=160453 RepID=UPI001C8C4D8E|nr:ribokinase [Enterococcus gilvus]MBX8935890.1 ribokinase [Enterococcus gilvus]
MKVVVVGSINLDLVVQADRFPKVGETLFGLDSQMLPGGKGANQAVAAARLGADVTMIGCVGKDAYGEIVLKNFQENQVDTSCIKQVAAPTGVAYITIAENDNSIILVQGANACVDRSVVAEYKTQILAADIVITQCEIPLDTIEYLIDFCAENNICLVLNPAPTPEIAPEYLAKATFLTPNEIEINQLFQQDAQSVLQEYPNQIIMTYGSKGVRYHDGEKLVEVPSYKVPVVDTTGAGDTFNAAFAVAYGQNQEIESAIKFANLAASKTVQGLGAQPAMPRIAELTEE